MGEGWWEKTGVVSFGIRQAPLQVAEMHPLHRPQLRMIDKLAKHLSRAADQTEKAAPADRNYPNLNTCKVVARLDKSAGGSGGFDEQAAGWGPNTNLSAWRGDDDFDFWEQPQGKGPNSARYCNNEIAKSPARNFAETDCSEWDKISAGKVAVNTGNRNKPQTPKPVLVLVGV